MLKVENLRLLDNIAMNDPINIQFAFYQNLVLKNVG